jgi:ATP-dependent Zn protease
MNSDTPTLLNIFINWFPMLLLIGVWIFFLRKMRGSSSYTNLVEKQIEETRQMNRTLERIAAVLEKSAEK